MHFYVFNITCKYVQLCSVKDTFHFFSLFSSFFLLFGFMQKYPKTNKAIPCFYSILIFACLTCCQFLLLLAFIIIIIFFYKNQMEEKHCKTVSCWNLQAHPKRESDTQLHQKTPIILTLNASIFKRFHWNFGLDLIYFCSSLSVYLWSVSTAFIIYSASNLLEYGHFHLNKKMTSTLK